MGLYPGSIHTKSGMDREGAEKLFTQGYMSQKKVQSVTVKSALPAV